MRYIFFILFCTLYLPIFSQSNSLFHIFLSNSLIYSSDDEIGYFTDDRDKNEYEYANFGKQTWMIENLKYLPEVYSSSDFSVTLQRYYVYDNFDNDLKKAKSNENYKKYGVLYNWQAAMNSSISSNANPSKIKGICPIGWHIPSDSEWQELERYLKMTNKEAKTTGWRGKDSQASMLAGDLEKWTKNNRDSLVNSDKFEYSHFNALPAGALLIIKDKAVFAKLNEACFFWTSTATDDNKLAFYRSLSLKKTNIFRQAYKTDYAYSVRCVKD